MTIQETILIIDDETTIRGSLKSFFEDEGYLVFSAESGEHGLDIVFSERIDLVITDLRMPGMDGIEVMKAIHKHKPDTPLIVISGAGKKEDIIKALRMGAKDYITKPIQDLDMISHTVRQALENRRLIEENRKYRERLEKSEYQYRTITENIAEGVFTVDEHENFTYANQAFCIMLGYSNDEILKKNIKDISNDDGLKVIQRQTENRKNGLSGRYEIEIFDRNNHPVHVELACSPIIGDKSIYKGTIAVVRDITKLIELRKKFQRFLLQKDSNSKDILSICANCKSIRMEKNNWVPVENYFSTIVFSHGICPECCEKLYPGFDFSDMQNKESSN